MASNYSDYLSHTIIDPVYYQRRYEHDLPKANFQWMETAKRVLLIALPFLSLHKPLGQAISVGMGSCRVFSHLFDASVAGYKGKMKECAGQMALSALAVMVLAGAFFNFKLGLILTTLMDLKLSLKHLMEQPFNFEEFLHSLSSAFYLSILVSNSLELILLSILLQGLIGIYQARLEWKDGKWPEAVSKLLLSLIRFHEAYNQGLLIQRRNEFLALEKFKKLMQLVEKGRKVEHLIHSPLQDRKEPILLVDAEGNPYNFGTHFHGSGKELVKGMNLQFRTRVLDDRNMRELEFEVNHVFRKGLQELIDEINHFAPGEIKEFLNLTHSHATDIKVEEIPFKLSNKTEKSLGNAYRVTLEGLGSILIGNSPEYPNLYDRVRVEIDENQTLYGIHELLSFFHLSDALTTSSKEDIERLKIGQLFRIFYPREATLLERQEQFFMLPTNELKTEIIKQVPSMQETFDTYLPKMELQETLPGRGRYTLPQISEMVYNLGGRALIASLMGIDSNQEGFVRLASILKIGILSSEMRYINDMTIRGLSSQGDFYTGAADSVFTQFITEKNLQEKMSFNGLYSGNIRLLFSLDALNTGTYQYHHDAFGTRIVNSSEEASQVPYLNRPNIFDFTKREAEEFQQGNEVMVKEMISPSMIKRVLVSDDSIRNELIDYLRSNGLVNASEGIEKVLGIPVDRFVQVANNLSEELLA